MAAVYERGGQWLPVPRPTALRLVVRGALLNALAYTDGHQGEAARWLDMTPRQLSYQLRLHGIPGNGQGRAARPRVRRSRARLRVVPRRAASAR